MPKSPDIQGSFSSPPKGFSVRRKLGTPDFFTLGEKPTTPELFAFYCKEALNPTLSEKDRKTALLLANSYLGLAAAEAVLGDKVGGNEVLSSLSDPRVKEAREKILNGLRRDKRDPKLQQAIELLFPSPAQEPTGK